MAYLIDGHNLIPKVPGIRLQDIDDEIELIKVLQDFCRQRGKRVEVYFDNAPAGVPRTRRFGLVTAHFVRQGRTADSAIHSRLQKIGRESRNWTVVTSDREVAAEARAAGARVIASDEFARDLHVTEPAGETTPEMSPDLSLDPNAVADWLEIFGAEDEE